MWRTHSEHFINKQHVSSHYQKNVKLPLPSFIARKVEEFIVRRRNFAVTRTTERLLLLPA